MCLIADDKQGPAKPLALASEASKDEKTNEYIMSIRLRFETQNAPFDSRQYTMEVPLIADADLDEVAHTLSQALYKGWNEFQEKDQEPNQTEE